MLDPLDYAKFIELASLLGPKAFTCGKIHPHYKLICNVQLKPASNPKGPEISCNWPEEEFVRPLGVKQQP